MEKYKRVNKKDLRYGFTTGSCATGATKAAAKMLFTNQDIQSISFMTPKGWELTLDVLEIVRDERSVSCAIQKDAGDDPDVTSGLKIYSKVSLIPEGIVFHAGEGVGTVTKKGLELEVGEPAINKTPRRMIAKELENISEEFDYSGGFDVTISVENGFEIAKKTYNSNLGILGGVSIIGTTGIVEPMSQKALIESVRIEIRVRREESDHLYLSIGNYGKDFYKKYIEQELIPVKVSNYVGEAFLEIDNLKFSSVLFIGHIGKMVKIAGGIMNTHSAYADSRLEILAAFSSLKGGSNYLVKKILSSTTTDEAIGYIKEEGILNEVMDHCIDRVHYHLKRKAPDIELQLVIFSNIHGILAEKNVGEKRQIEPEISIVGVGPGDPSLVCPQAVKEIEKAQVLVGAKRHLEMWRSNKETLDLSVGLKNVVQELKTTDKRSTVLVSGDTGFYSLAKYIRENVGRAVSFVPGISAMVYFYSKLGRKYQDAQWLSVHGREMEFIEQSKKAEVCLLTDQTHTPAWIASELIKNGLKKELIIGEQLSYPQERIERFPAEEVLDKEYDPLCVVIIKDLE